MAKAADLFSIGGKQQTQANLRGIYIGRAVTALKSNDLKSFNEFAKLGFANFPEGTDNDKKIKSIEEGMKEALKNQVSDRALVRIARQTDWRGFDRPMMKLFANAFAEATKPENRVIDDKVSGGTVVHKAAEALQKQFADDVTIHVNEADKEQYKYLGGGAKNSVYKVSYGDQGTPTVKVFKPLKEGETADRLSPGALGGIPRKKPEFLHLAVASSKVCDLFGFENRYVKTNFATVNGKRGIVMDMAPGGPPKVSGELPTKVGTDPTSRTNVTENELLEKQGKRPLNDLELKSYAGLLGCRRLEVRKDGVYRIDATHSNFEPKSARMRRELTELQLLDVICGQMDRHPENYYVDSQGGVCGIDNDLAFGTEHKNIHDARKLGAAVLGFMPNRGSLLLKPPSIIDHTMFQKVVGVSHNSDAATIRRSIEAKAKALGETLAEHMTPEQVDVAVNRYTQLADHCVALKNQTPAKNTTSTASGNNQPPGPLIGDDAWAGDNVRDKMMDRDSSYFGREMLVLKQNLKAKDGAFDFGKWTHLRK